jgi:hypothetical protein
LPLAFSPGYRYFSISHFQNFSSRNARYLIFLDDSGSKFRYFEYGSACTVAGGAISEKTLFSEDIDGD